MAVLLFWISLVITFYSYIGYPVFIWIMGTLFTSRRMKDDHYQPMVSMIVSAYNEEAIIQEKIANFLNLDFPKSRIELLIGSDGSTDKTNQILAKNKSEQIHSFIYESRSGKSSVLNRLVKKAQGDILVFSDANTMYEANAIQKLVRHFADTKIGGVCGKLHLINPNDNSGGKGETLYWDYENRLKFFESRFQTVLGANGAIYALRRALYRALPENKVIMDDFIAPLKVVEQKYHVIYEPEALGIETTSQHIEGEFRRKIRIGAANFNALNEISALLNPLRGFVAFGLWSHKIFRWFVPFLLVICFVSNVFLLDNSYYHIVFVLQCFFYGCAFVAFLLNLKGYTIRIFTYPLYFCAVNLALAIGFYKFLTKSQKPAWQRVERS
jgi:poly-beta-1,6-N-acetyl-D-glucosamine synthase